MTQKVFVLRLLPNDGDDAVQDRVGKLNTFLTDNTLLEVQNLNPQGAGGFCYVLFVGTPILQPAVGTSGDT